MGAYAADGVGFGREVLEEAGDFVGGVLEVGVERGNEGAASVAEAGGEAGALAGVGGVKEAADGGILGLELADAFGGAIGAGVVDEDDFVGEVAGLEGLGDGVGEFG